MAGRSVTKTRPLTPKRQRFVEEYVVDLNGTQAAIRAGYSPKTAQMQSSRLLLNAMVQIAVAKKLAKLSEGTEETAARVLADLRDVVERCRQATPVTDRKGEIIKGEYQFKEHGALKGLELIGKHLAMFTEVREIHDKRVKVD